jgi:hypothetical protein
MQQACFESAQARPVGKFPVFVNVTVPESAALANWKSRSAFIAGGTLLVVVCPLLLLLMLRKLMDSVITSERSLEQNARELAQLNHPPGCCLQQYVAGTLFL